MSESELIKRITELETQVHDLLSENERLRGLLGIESGNVSEETASQSDNAEKENSIITLSTQMNKVNQNENGVPLNVLAQGMMLMYGYSSMSRLRLFLCENQEMLSRRKLCL